MLLLVEREENKRQPRLKWLPIFTWTAAVAAAAFPVSVLLTVSVSKEPHLEWTEEKDGG